MGDELSLGDYIKAYREARGLSQRQLSLASDLSPSYVSKIEAGESEPSFRAFSRLAKTLGFTNAEIVHLVKHEGVRVSGPRHDRQSERQA